VLCGQSCGRADEASGTSPAARDLNDLALQRLHLLGATDHVRNDAAKFMSFQALQWNESRSD
jgi:hypothetical protein